MLELASRGPPADDEVVISVVPTGVGNWDDIVRVGGWSAAVPPDQSVFGMAPSP